jgi:hypothetical protein
MLKPAIVILLCVLVYTCTGPQVRVEQIVQEYIDGWIEFYPTRAFAAGHLDSAFRFESVSLERTEAWVDFNRQMLESLDGLPNVLSSDEGADGDLLRRQILGELDSWENERVFETSPMFYAGRVSQALTHILARDDLSPGDKLRAVEVRLAGIRAACVQGMIQLRNGRPHSTARSILVLEATSRFLEDNLIRIAGEWKADPLPEEFANLCLGAAGDVRALATHIRDQILPNTSLLDSMGRDDYARNLEVFTGTDMTPEELAEIALQEIKEVRGLMDEVAGAYWKERYPGQGAPADYADLVERAIEDMEENRESRQQDFLKLFEDLIDHAEDFVRDKDIATLPEERTLFTALSPSHFSGAAVGGVYAAGPFNPGAVTLLYLPTIPDEAPEAAKEGFYRSFNNHFNTMIITHEIFPGHYMQSKIASTSPHLVRDLFSDGLYVEGWATLCEVITLDAGWNGFDKLDRLAHLRKRLENATRAYTSVQVHCFGWGKEEVAQFAVDEGLLAPQFALNLWDRVTGSPLQLTSYFLGFRKFSTLLEDEKARQGEEFELKSFCDAILQAGAVSIDRLPDLIR